MELEKAIRINQLEQKKLKKQVYTKPDLFIRIESFMRDKKLIGYGGTAINRALPKEAQFYHASDIPDYDFFSTSALDHAKELADRLHPEYPHIEVKPSMFHGTYKLFVNFEEFKKQANLVVKKQPENYEDSYQYYCNYEEFSRSLTLNNASAADEEDEDDGYEEFSLSDRYENEDEYWSRNQEEKRSQIREDEDEEFQEWVIKSLEILKEM
jgi:hypothetical protein